MVFKHGHKFIYAPHIWQLGSLNSLDGLMWFPRLHHKRSLGFWLVWWQMSIWSPRYHAGSVASLKLLCFEELRPHGEIMQSSSWQFPATPSFLVIPVQRKNNITRLFQPQSFKSLLSIQIFPAKTPDIMEQRQDILSGLCPNSWTIDSICIIIIILLLFYVHRL